MIEVKWLIHYAKYLFFISIFLILINRMNENLLAS